MDIYNGKLGVILSLIWTLIQQFQIYGHLETEPLLAWINAQIPNQHVKNFTTDWNDGVALCALVDYIQPGLCPNCATLDREKKLSNCKKGIKLAEDKLGIKRIIEANELCSPEVDECCVVTYISSFCKPANCLLLKWIQGLLPKRNIKNLGTDWKDGVNLAYLLNTLLPGLFPICDELEQSLQTAFKSLTQIMNVGEERTGIKPPSKLDSDNIDELSMSTYLAQFWHARSIPNDIQCTGYGLDSKAFVGQSATFEINATKFGLESSDLNVSILNSKGKSIQPCITSNDNEGYQVEYVPWSAGKLEIDIKVKGFAIRANPFQIEVINLTDSLTQQNDSIINLTKAGSYKVVITCAGDSISGSPIHLTASDPSRCYFTSEAKLPRFVQVNETCSIELNTKEAGPGSVKVSSSQTDVLTLQGESDVDNEVYTIQLIPNKVGEATVDVTFNGVSLVQHTVFVCDASKCIASGEVFQSGCVICTKEFEVTVQTKGAGKGELTGKLVGPQTIYPITPHANSDGIYHFSLTPYDTGKHSLHIFWGGVDIPKSPYSVKVSSDASQYSASGDGLKEAVAHKTAKFMLKGPESSLVKESRLQACINNVQLQHKSKMVNKEEFDCSSETSLVYVTDDQKWSYSIYYRVPCHGIYTLDIKIDGKSIPSSPFHVRVHSAFDPSKCKVFGKAIEDPYSLVVGKSIEFKVDTTEAGTGELTAKVTAPTMPSPVVTISDENSSYSKKIYAIKIDPEENGEYKVDLYWNKEIVPGSPFSFEVGDPTKVKVSNLPAPSKYIAEVKKPLRFTVDTKHAGKGKLECTVKTSSIEDGRSHDHERTIEPELQDDMTYLFTYTPYNVGQMQLCLTYNGESVLPSAWECEIANPEHTQVIPLIRNLYGKQCEHMRFIVSGLSGNEEKNMKITVLNPQHKELKVKEDKVYESSTVYYFIPQHVGKYEVSVKVDNRDIHGSPFHVKIVNPDACIAQEDLPRAVYLSQNKQFLIDTSEAGPGEFTFDTDDSSTSPRLLFEFNSEYPNQVKVKGLEPGRSKAFLKWGGYEIPDMPMEITIFDLQQTHVACEQIEAGNIKTTDRVTLDISTTSSGSCEPIVLVKGPTMMYPVEIKEIESGKYKASFTPQETGQQLVEIFVDNVMLPDCPLKFTTLEEKITPEESSGEMHETDYVSEVTLKRLDNCNDQEDVPLSDKQTTVVIPTDQSMCEAKQLYQPDSESITRKVELKPDTSQQTKDVHTQTHITYKVKQEIQVGIPFTIRVDTKDKEKTDLRLRVVDSSKEHEIEIEEKREEWRATYTALEKGGQELQVLCGDSDIEISGTPIEIFAANRKRSIIANRWKTAFFILAAAVLLLFLLLLVTALSFDVTDPTVRPI